MGYGLLSYPFFKKKPTKTKDMKKTFLVLFVVGVVVARAQPMPIGNRYYQPYINYNNTGLRLSITSYVDHTAKVLSYTGSGKNVVVPQEFEYEGNIYTVTSIGDYAFYCNGFVRNISLPPTIKRIGLYAFFSVNAYMAYLPDSLEYIGEYAFSGVTTGTYNIPAKTRYIQAGAFSQNRATEFVVSGDNPYYTAVDGVLYNKDTTTLVAWPCNKAGGTYTVPEGVRRIEADAFSYLNPLSEIVLPQSLRELGRRSTQTTGDVPLHIPGGVCRIEGNPVLGTRVILDSLNGVPNQHYRFDGDRLVSLDGDTLILWNNMPNTVVVPQGIKVIAPECFANYTNITEVVLPEGLTTLSMNSLQAGGFHSNMPSTVRYIGRSACESVKYDSLIIPEGVTGVGKGAFAGAVISGKVRFPTTLKAISDSMFHQARIGSFEFSEGLEEIGVNGFAMVHGLDSNAIHRFPSTLRRVCNGAFGLSGMRHLVFTGDIDTIGAQLGGSPIRDCRLHNIVPPMIYPGALNPSYDGLRIIVPCGTVPVYQSARGFWEQYDDSVFEENCEGIEETDTFRPECWTVARKLYVESDGNPVGVYDIGGRQIAFDGSQSGLKMFSLPTAGVYLVRISTGHGTAFKKLVVK